VWREQCWRTVDRAVSRPSGRVGYRLAAPRATSRYRVLAPAVLAPRGGRQHRLPRWAGPSVRVRVSPPTPTSTPSPSTTPTPSPTPSPTQGPARTPWVTGYYAGYHHEWLYPPEQVDMSAMTHFVFARLAPAGGTLGAGEPDDPRFPGYPYRTGDVVPGAGFAQVPGRAPDGSGRSVEDYLVDRAHAAGTQALVMLGGMGDGLGFLRSTTDAVRPRFVDSVVDHLVTHGYDGLDLDWEDCLQGEPDCGGVPAAEAQRRLLALIADLRAEAASRPAFAGRPLLITFPGYALNLNTDLEDGIAPAWRVRVARAVDQYNLMSYGVGTTMNGAGWDSWFSGALTGASPRTPVDVASSVAAYVAAGVPRERIGIGIGLFGVYWGPEVTGPRQDTEGVEVWETDDNALGWSELERMGYLDHGTGAWDAAAQSTYRSYGGGGFVPAVPDQDRAPAGFLSYEDARSIAAKADWVEANGVGGTIVWTLNYGWSQRTRTNPLMEVVKREFLGR
jgi:GH18 family chitinase